MREFKGKGHSHNGRAFSFVGAFDKANGELVWTAVVHDCVGRSPMKLSGHLDHPENEDAEKAVLERLHSEIAKRRL